MKLFPLQNMWNYVNFRTVAYCDSINLQKLLLDPYPYRNCGSGSRVYNFTRIHIRIADPDPDPGCLILSKVMYFCVFFRRSRHVVSPCSIKEGEMENVKIFVFNIRKAWIRILIRIRLAPWIRIPICFEILGSVWIRICKKRMRIRNTGCVFAEYAD